MLYLILSIPSAAMLYQLGAGATDAGDLLHGSGEMSARLMIIAMAASPLRAVWSSARWTAWLIRNRRAFGVMAFAYAALHTVFYVLDMGTLQLMLDELGAIGIWTGWVALAIFIPLAITSNDASARALGKRWRLLHRTVYVSAVLVLVHWITVHNNAGPAWVHFAPLILLEAIRVYKTSRA